MQMNVREQKTEYNEIYSEGLQDIVATSDLGMNIGLINSFSPRKIQKQSEDVTEVYNRIKKFILENVLNYQYRIMLINKITFLFKYGKVDLFKDQNYSTSIFGSVKHDGDLSYTLSVKINDSEIVVNSIDVAGNKSISNTILVTYKTTDQDDMQEYIKDTTIKNKKYRDVDTWYEDENVVEKFCALKQGDNKIITALKRRNTSDKTSLLYYEYSRFKTDRVIKENKKFVTEWNGLGLNRGYVIGSYKEQDNDKISENYFYAARNNCPTYLDINSDCIKVKLTGEDFVAAIKDEYPVLFDIREAEKEYTFGFLQQINSEQKELTAKIEEAKKSLKRHNL